MITPDNVKVAIVMMRRASCTGDEAKNVALAIDAFERLFVQMSQAQAEQPKVEGGTNKPSKKRKK